jgi:hypothetical protein
MTRQPVRSTSLRSVGYDAEHGLLEIEFRSGNVYQYSGVPEETYSGLMTAPFIGSFFHKNIKDRYPCLRIR